MIMSFDYTRAAFRRLGRRIDALKWGMDYGVHIVMIAYLTLAMLMGWGRLLINATLMGLTIATLVYTIVYSRKDLSKKAKKQAKEDLKKFKRRLRVCSLFVKGVSFAVTLYGMASMSNNVLPINIVFTTLLLIVWIISAVTELTAWIIETEKEYFEKAFDYDRKFGEERDFVAGLIGKSSLSPKDKILAELAELVEEERASNVQKVVNGVQQAVDSVKAIFNKGA